MSKGLPFEIRTHSGKTLRLQRIQGDLVWHLRLLEPTPDGLVFVTPALFTNYRELSSLAAGWPVRFATLHGELVIHKEYSDGYSLRIEGKLWAAYSEAELASLIESARYAPMEKVEIRKVR